MTQTHQLSELQIALLRVLWERGEATVAEVHAALEPERKLATTTVSTLLSRLERKGVLTHRIEGRTFIYRAKVSEEQIRHSMLAEVTDWLFKGNVGEVVSHLLRNNELSPGDVERVRGLIESFEENEESPDE